MACSSSPATSDLPAYNNGAHRADDRRRGDVVDREGAEFFDARGPGFSLWIRTVDDDAELLPRRRGPGIGRSRLTRR